MVGINSFAAGAGGTTTILRDDTSIGWEFDLINEIQIYNNLRFFVGGGFLIAGNAMDVATRTGGTAVSAAGVATGLFKTAQRGTPGQSEQD